MTMIAVWHMALATVCAGAVGCAATWLVVALTRRFGLFDQPNERSAHTVPTPTAGGLGVVAGNVTRVSDEMFRAASRTLAASAADERKKTGSLLPPLPSIRDVSKDIAFAVASKAQEQGNAPKTTPEELRAKIEEKFWDPAYDD